jgi:hypothetical protein
VLGVLIALWRTAGGPSLGDITDDELVFTPPV